MINRLVKTIAVTAAVLPLCSCWSYMNISPETVTVPPEKMVERDLSHDDKALSEFIKNNLNYGYYTEQNIKKLYGDPLRKEQNGNQSRLVYKDYTGEYREVSFPLFFPVSHYGKPDLERSFLLNEDRLSEIAYQDIKITEAGIFLIFPAYQSKLKGINPFIGRAFRLCNGFADKVDIIFNNIPPSIAKNYRYCMSDNFLDIRYVTLYSSDYYNKNGYKTKDFARIFEYNPQILPLTPKNAIQYAEQRLSAKSDTGLRPAETSLTTKEMNCRLFRLTGKKTKNAGSSHDSDDQITDIASAICFVKGQNAFIEFEVEDQYPGSAPKAKTAEEQLKAIIRAVSFRE